MAQRIALAREHTKDHVLEDHKKLPENEQPKFKLKSLEKGQRREVRDLLARAIVGSQEVDGKPQVEMRMDIKIHANEKAVEYGLTGWNEHVGDADGQPWPFPGGKKAVDELPTQVINELGEEIQVMSQLTEDQEKN